MARIYRAYFSHVNRDGVELDVGALHDAIKAELERACIPAGTLYLAATICHGRREPATVLEVVDQEAGLKLGASPGAVIAVARRIKELFKLHAVMVTAQGADTQALEV